MVFAVGKASMSERLREVVEGQGVANGSAGRVVQRNVMGDWSKTKVKRLCCGAKKNFRSEHENFYLPYGCVHRGLLMRVHIGDNEITGSNRYWVPKGYGSGLPSGLRLAAYSTTPTPSN